MLPPRSAIAPYILVPLKSIPMTICPFELNSRSKRRRPPVHSDVLWVGTIFCATNEATIRMTVGKLTLSFWAIRAREIGLSRRMISKIAERFMPRIPGAEMVDRLPKLIAFHRDRPANIITESRLYRFRLVCTRPTDSVLLSHNSNVVHQDKKYIMIS